MYKPEDLDKEALQQSIDAVDDSLERQQKVQEELNRQEQARKKAEYAEQQKAIDEGNAAAAKNEKDALKNAQEIAGNIGDAINNNGFIQGLNQATNARNIGYLRGLNGIFTLPERTWDWATGAMQKETEQNGSYSPGWDPFREKIDNNAPKNWWEAGFQIGGQESITIGATAGFGLATGLAKSVAGRIGLAGIEQMASPDTGQENNVSGSVRWAFENPDKAPKWLQKVYDTVESTMPWLGDGLRYVAVNNPLATNEGDDVNTKTLKSILENMMFEGTGEVLDFLYGSRKAEVEDIGEQIMEKADQEFQVDAEGLPSQTIDVEALDVTTDPAGGRRTLPEGDPNVESPGTFRASKNPEMADVGQGNYNSRTTAGTQYARRSKQTDSPDDMGTTGSSWSAAQIEDFSQGRGIPAEDVDDLAKQLYKSAYYQQAAGGKDWAAANAQAFRRFQKILGLNADNIDSKKFWDELIKQLGRDPKKWPIDPVVSDLLATDLFSQIRNRGMAALELGEKFDLMDTDGPMHNIAQRLALYGNEVSKAKFAMNPDILKLPAGKRKAAMDEFSEADYQFYSEKVQDFMSYIKNSPDEDMAKFAAEMFAKQNIHSMPELQNYLRHRFKGEKFRGAKGQRALMRELNAMTMLSQLADPETIIRAGKSTAEILGLQSTTRMIGAGLRGDFRRARAAAAEFGAIKEVFPDVLQIFKKNADAWWNKDFAQVGNRYKVTLDNDQVIFDRFFEDAMKNGTLGDKVYAATLNTVRALNRWQGFSYPFAGLSSIDQILGVVGANMRARNKAFMEMSEGKKPWESIGDKKAYNEARQNYYNAIVDDKGNIDFDSDIFFEAAYKEATLTKPLGGPLKHLDNMVEEYPALGLFYRYTTTAVNDIMMDYKYTPLLGAIHKETLDIQKAIAKNDFTDTLQYGIDNMDDAMVARDVILGRQALGVAVTSSLLAFKMNGMLTGNGTIDWKINEGWKQLGWKANTLTLGNFEIDLSEIPGIGGMLGLASDIIDNRKFMGDDWADNNLAMVAFAVGQSLTTKQMFEPVNNLLRALRGEEGMQKRMLVNLASSIPGAKMFDKLGEIMMPYQVEMSKSIYDQMRNRFKAGELFRAEEDRLQPKVDILYNTQLSPWDYVENAVNMVSPIDINLREERPAMDILTNSGYPTAIISNQHKGIDFSNDHKIRTAYNKELAKQGLGPAIEKLMNDPMFVSSYEQYHKDIENNKQVDNPVGSYYHLKRLNKLIKRAKDKAWASITTRPDVQELIEADLEKRREQKRRLYESKQPTLQTMYR